MSQHILPLASSQNESPFDATRQNRPDGSEFWSARDLMPLMGYSRWNEFKTPIERAMKTSANQGMTVADLFSRSTEKTAGRPREDFELARYAAYLVAMNGDPNIKNVAAAQHYFAIQTRVAETTATTTPVIPQNYAAALREAADQAERAERAEKFKEEIEAGDGLTVRKFHKKYFSEVTETEVWNHLYAKGYIINQLGKGPLRTEGKMAGTFRDGSQHRHPGYKGKAFFYLHCVGIYGGKRREETYVRPGAPELALRDRLASEGLIANSNTAGLFAIADGKVKELS